MRGKKKARSQRKKNIKMFMEERAHQLCVCILYFIYKDTNTHRDNVSSMDKKK